ncbi:MAG: hypothetical protein C4297_01525 [Gemmataceae bacterium]
MSVNRIKALVAAVALGASGGLLWAADPLDPPMAAPKPLPSAQSQAPTVQQTLVDNHACPDHGCTRLYGSAEVLWLRRTDSRRENLTFNDTPAFLLSSDQGEFDWEIGGRFLVGMFLDNNNSLEAMYFGLQTWGKSAFVTNINETLQPYWGQFGVRGGLDDSAFTDAFAHGFQYESRLHNGEINLRHWYNSCLSTLAGIRYLNVRDKFWFGSLDDISAVPFGPCSGLYEVRTKNNLLGLQLGADAAYPLLCDTLRVGVRGKTGLFLNFAEQSSRFLNIPTEGEGRTTDERTDEDGVRLAGVIEVGAYATYWITKNIAIRGGYDLIYVAGLALAPENLDNSPLPLNARRNLKDNGDIIYHGPSVGIEVRW